MVILMTKISVAYVIVLAGPTSPSRSFLKRIVGTPGDTIDVRVDGTVGVNGRPLEEPYAVGPTTCGGPQCNWKIPAASGGKEPPELSPGVVGQYDCASEPCYLVLGDNRRNSSDSRQGWLVPVRNIYGFVKSDPNSRTY